MAYVKIQPRTQIKTGRDIAPITLDGGVNRYGTVFNIAPNEAWDCNNTTSKIPGALSVKPADTVKISKIPGGETNFNYYWILDGLASYTTNIGEDVGRDFIVFVAQDPDDTEKYYLVKWNLYTNAITLKSCPLSGTKTVLTKHTDTLDYIIVANSSGVYETHGTEEFAELTNAPKTHLYTQDDYRLFALKGNVLSWCDPDDMNNWSTGDAGQIVLTDMKGQGSAIITMNDMVYCFSEKTLHILYGDDTGNYQVSNVIYHGCIGRNAVIKKDNSIYFMDFDGLKVYNSGQISVISDKIDSWIQTMYTSKASSVAFKNFSFGINNDYLYLSLPLNNASFNNETFELNLKTGAWHRWNEGYYSFTKVGKNFYGMKITGLYEVGTNNTHATSWEHITPMRRSQFNKQTISSIPVLLTLPTGSTLKVAYNTNDTTPSWTDLYTFTPNDVTQEVIIDVPRTVLNNNMMYQLKFYGTGPCTIHEIGSDGRVIIR